jgi:hypothetical protein
MATPCIIVNDNRNEYDAFMSILEACVDDKWNLEAKGILKAELARRHLSYKDLVERLAAVGETETEANLRNKISRGGFSAGFFIACLTAIGAHTVRLYEAN